MALKERVRVAFAGRRKRPAGTEKTHCILLKMNTIDRSPRPLAALVFAVALTGSAAGVAAQSTVHLDDARDLVAQMRAQGEAGLFFDENGVEYNQYGASWADSFIVLDNPAYAHAVCSNFYIRLMMGSYPGWTAQGVGFAGASPNSATIHDAIEVNARSYAHVTDFAQAQPGDVLVIKYLDGGSSPGHTMLLDCATPAQVLLNGTVRWSVKVIDCSSGVRTLDTRVFPGYPSTGVGSGYLNVYTFGGAITGYSSSQGNGSKIYGRSARHMTVGRITW
jgi:hypothetical protein